MKSKAPLALMEQMVMLLVFALAAALCLQAFVKSDDISQGSQARDRAVELAQSAAETLKSCGGDLEAAAEKLGGYTYGDSLTVFYDGDWLVTPVAYGADGAADGQDAAYDFSLNVALTAGSLPTLGTAQVWVKDLTDDTELFRMEIAWQEVYESGC